MNGTPVTDGITSAQMGGPGLAAFLPALQQLHCTSNSEIHWLELGGSLVGRFGWKEPHASSVSGGMAVGTLVTLACGFVSSVTTNNQLMMVG